MWFFSETVHHYDSYIFCLFVVSVFAWALDHRMGRPAEEILLFVSGVEEFLLGSNILGWKEIHTDTLRRNQINEHSDTIGKLCVSGKLSPEKYYPSLNNVRKFMRRGSSWDR